MSFQDFCSNAYEIDKQIVETRDSFVIHFKKETGTAFTVDPNDIIEFLRFLVLNHKDCVSAIQNDERFSKESYLNYDEKPYRALYRLTASTPELKTILSLGGSQTKELTKVISKLICYLAQISYKKIEENTHFDLDSLNLALKNTPTDLRKISQKYEDIQPISRRKAFFNWLIKQGKAEKTANSYSGTVLNVANSTLAENSIPNNFDLISTPETVSGLHEKLKQVKSWIDRNNSGGGMYDAGLNSYREFVASQNQASITAKLTSAIMTLSKPFLLLAGISGTGKTRFVREQAKTSGQFAETYCLTSVRPDWHEPSDLLGYVSRLNGNAEYITTDVLQFIAKAWRAIADSGLQIDEQCDEDFGERLVVTGESDALEQVLPFWLCLDEMNLAPVEQYFADYLSVLETREWRWVGNNFTYSSDPLLKPATIKEVADGGKLRSALGFGSEAYSDLWDLICQYGLGIPFNLMVAGTVNMDETTHGFSRKVIDRALSFDFGEFFPNDYADFFTPKSCNKRLSYPIWSHASQADLANTFDADGKKTVEFLSSVNEVLKNTPFELAFRALNELLLAVVSSQPKDDLTLKAVWDDFMMCKVLPRIEGDTDKLTISDGKALLAELNTVLADQLAPIWQAAQEDNNQRPDLYREKVVADSATDKDKVLRIPCRSKAKLKWMSDRLASATFTSFWP